MGRIGALIRHDRRWCIMTMRCCRRQGYQGKRCYCSPQSVFSSSAKPRAALITPACEGDFWIPQPRKLSRSVASRIGCQQFRGCLRLGRLLPVRFWARQQLTPPLRANRAYVSKPPPAISYRGGLESSPCGAGAGLSDEAPFLKAQPIVRDLIAVRSSIRFSSIVSGIDPSFSTSWNHLRSNRSPSSACAFFRALTQAVWPIL